MIINFQQLFTKGAELYDLAPGLFNWAGGIAVAGYPALAYAAWWFRGRGVAAREDGLNSKIEGLNARIDGLNATIHGKDSQIAVMGERLSLAKEQNEAAKREADNFKAEIASLKEQIAQGAPLNDLAIATARIEGTLNRLVTANNVVSGTLTLPAIDR
jgi:hypothetical protein